MQAPKLETAAQQLLKLSKHLGINYIFVNLGSDHPAFIEALARLHVEGVDMPKVISCPHEMTALSAAHGYAMITRRPQMVLVHVDVGTQNLGGSVHNAARGRIPAIVVAGLSPVTTSGERIGARNEFIHYIQDTPRQHEIVAQYMKWAYELRAAETVESVLLRGVQMATTMPEGPVYISGAREVWDAPAPPSQETPAHWPPANLAGLPRAAAAEIYRAICAAKRPIVITTYLGRQPKAVERLLELSDRLGIGVCEVSPQYLNFPGDHPHHLSYRRNTLVDEADLILMIDVDVPWIVSKTSPARDAKLFHIDLDPIKTGMGFWHFPAQGSYLADSLKALDDLLDIAGSDPAPGRAERCAWIAASKQRLSPPRPQSTGLAITPEELTAAVRELVNERTVIVFEEPSSTELVPPILRLTRPGSFFHSGGIGLGWGINAAVGAKLAVPDAEVISLIGDGCYLFGVPSSAYWVAGTYATPHLTVIYNNGGWNSPKLSTLGVHPEGYAKQHDRYWITVGSGARLADIAEATGGAEAYQVSDREKLKETLRQALQTVRQGRCAVVDVAITGISAQVLN
ncbi:MAG: thiamine pyrophosphate-requiring protein [Rhodocyclaceae bacterium]|nr:MAG: thiamine pyrophosphate-requiring protein [Rhodocyclaceae bacterium]